MNNPEASDPWIRLLRSPYRSQSSKAWIEWGRAIDLHLHDKNSSDWLSLKKHQKLFHDTSLDYESPHYHLVANEAVLIDNIQGLLDVPYVDTIYKVDDISLFAADKLMGACINRVWRSDLHGGDITIIDYPSRNQFEALSSAISLLRAASPTAYCFVTSLVKRIYLLESASDQGNIISLTVKYLPGIMLASYVNHFDLAESILHESTHLWLNGVERVEKLVSDETGLFCSPLRKDPRPLMSIIHQALVLRNLHHYYLELRTNTELTKSLNIDRVMDRLISTEYELNQAIEVLRCNINQLTDPGRALCDAFIF
jgi:hypothetical protein